MASSTLHDVGEFPVIGCPDCGRREMRRLGRVGFLQDKVFPLFGFYPWECPICRKRRMMRLRGKRIRRTVSAG